MFPIDRLEAEGVIGPAVLWSPSLPSGTEGLAIVDSAPHVVIDPDPRGDKVNALNDLSATAFAALTSRPGLRLPVVVTVECQFLEGPDGLLGAGPGRIS